MAEEAGVVGCIRGHRKISAATTVILKDSDSRVRRVLVDTGPLVAILSRADHHHEACVDTLRDLPAPLFSCWPVITEAVWLLRAYPSAVQQLLRSIGSGFIELLSLQGSEAKSIADVMKKYADLAHKSPMRHWFIWLIEKALTRFLLWTSGIFLCIGLYTRRLSRFCRRRNLPRNLCNTRFRVSTIHLTQCLANLTNSRICANRVDKIRHGIRRGDIATRFV